MPAKPKAIKAYNKELGKTFFFKKAKDAATYLGCDPSVITKVCKGRLDSSWGWTFSFDVPDVAQFVTEEQLKTPLNYKKKKNPWNKGKEGVYSEESLKKMSVNSKGKTLSKEAKAKLSKSLKKYYESNEHHAKGKNLDQEHKIKISQGLNNISPEDRKYLNKRISNSVKNTLKNRPIEIVEEIAAKKRAASTKTTYGQIKKAMKTNDLTPLFNFKSDNELLDIDKVQKVKCHCGRVWEVYLYEIVRGKTKSCGCTKSNPEREIFKFLTQELKIGQENIQKNCRPDFMDSKELDFLIPEAKVAIEHHGLAFHSERHWSFTNSTPRQYHLKKFKKCEKEGIKLIQFFEDEWKNKKEICKSMIASRLGEVKNKIYARKTEIVNLDSSENRNFFDRNHISGYTFAKRAWGLTYKGDLVCAASFRPVFNKKYKEQGYIEIARFASELNTQVVGGFSKLLKHAKKELIKDGFKGILTYADLRFGTGEVYKNSGFDIEGDTPPNYFYEKRGVRKSRHLCRKVNDPEFIKKYGKTEREQNNNQGQYAIYDAGSRIYTLKFNS